MRRLLSLLSLFLGSGMLTAQTTDILRAEYTLIPGSETEVQQSRYRFLFNAPFKVGDEDYLVTGLDYNQVMVESAKDLPFEKNEVRRLHVLDLNLGYVYKWKEQWRIIGVITPRLASNLQRGIQGRDFMVNASLAFWKENNTAVKPERLIFGLSYNATTGLPFPLPLFSYYKRFHPNWSYTVGVPRANLRYYPGEQHVIETALFLDGYFVNVQDNLVLENGLSASSISLSALIGALGYQYRIRKSFVLYALGGYTFFQNGVLRDDKRANVYVLSDRGNIYFRTGFRISIF